MSEFPELDKLVEECPLDTKLAVTAWVMKHIADHAKTPGSYRYLIYERLGFGPEAYGVLLDDGMFISNEFDINVIENIKTIVRENKIEALKEPLGLCDVPDCYNEWSSGFPSSDGYRTVCSKHSKDLC
jgi:hypothetical protein